MTVLMMTVLLCATNHYFCSFIFRNTFVFSLHTTTLRYFLFCICFSSFYLFANCIFMIAFPKGKINVCRAMFMFCTHIYAYVSPAYVLFAYLSFSPTKKLQRKNQMTKFFHYCLFSIGESPVLHQLYFCVT